MKKKRFGKMLMVFAAAAALSLTIPNAVNLPGTTVDAATVKISKKKATIIKGRSLTLKISGTSKKVKWSTSDKKVASVTSKGKVTGKKAGTATIKAVVNGKTYTCKVKVEAPRMSKTELSVKAGKTAALKLTGTTQKITWTSSNKKIATVTSKGLVKGVKKGTCKVYASVGGVKYSCKVTVGTSTVKVTDLVLGSGSLSLKVGESKTLKTTIKPFNATNKTIKWSSSDTSVAQVNSSGKITGVKTGSATITAKCGSIERTCSLTVEAKDIKQGKDWKVTYSYFNAYASDYDDANSCHYQAIIEIKNTGSCNLYVGSAVLDIYDQNNLFVASETFLSDDPSVIAPGEKAYIFNTVGSLDIPVGDYHMVPTYDIQYTEKEAVYYPVSNTSIRASSYGTVTVLGTLTNNSDEDISSLWVVAVLYNSAGKPIGVCGTNIMNTIKKGATRGFEISGMYLPAYVTLDKVASYEIIASPQQYQYD